MKRLLPRIVLTALLILGIAAMIYFRDWFSVAAIENWVAQAGAWAAIVFMLAYAVATVLFFPGAVPTLAGGALFGPTWGTFYNVTGSTLGASAAFLIARYLAADWVTQSAGGRLKRLITGVEREGWRFVAFSRLVPISPFNVLNYAFGVTRIPFSQYVIVTYICMIPPTLAFTYIGFAGREALGGRREDLIINSLIGLTLLAVVAFIPPLVKRFRKAREERDQKDDWSIASAAGDEGQRPNGGG
jgi:uncharacterized membrane protein YdjX (TVP38/TMEM64 family)